MTITYPDGRVLDAMVLSRNGHEIRATAPACDDTLAFTRVNGSWVSVDGEPVTIAFEWQRRDAPASRSDADFICPKELAARLIRELLRGNNRDEAVENAFFVFSPLGTRVAAPLVDLQVN